MATAPTLKMRTEIAEKIRQHGAATYPHECCGALLGRDAAATEGTATAGGVQLPTREILALFPLVNRREDSPRNRVSVNGEAGQAAGKAGQGKGLALVGWDHSHP